jgi:hypothetical protein
VRYWGALVDIVTQEGGGGGGGGEETGAHPLRVHACYNLAVAAWQSSGDVDGWRAARQQLVVLLAEVEARQVGRVDVPTTQREQVPHPCGPAAFRSFLS